MTKLPENISALIRSSVPIRQNTCAQVVEELKKLSSSSLEAGEKILQASKLIFGLNLRHVCIYKIDGRQLVPISQYGCEYKFPLNYDQVQATFLPVIDTANPRLMYLLPDDLEVPMSAELPETKSRFVLPIKNAQNEVAGILDLCSSVWYDFRKEEIESYVELAEQLAELME